MAKSTLTTINQIMSIASKAHYLNGGNASKILAKDKKGIFTIEQVAATLNVDPDELKTLLQQQGVMCGDYVITEEFGEGTKLSTYALRTLNNKIADTQNQSNIFDFLKLKKPQQDQKVKPWAVICSILWISVIPLLIMDHPLIAILNLLISIVLMIKPAYKQLKGEK